MTDDDISTPDRALRRLSVEEFLVDLLGGLVPGVLFFTAAATIVIPVLHSTLRDLGKTNHPDLEGAILAAVSATENTPNTLWFAVFVIVLLLAYVVGHLFYRHDPNVPDRRSFRWLARHRQYRNAARNLPSVKRLWMLVFRPWELDNVQVLQEELACDNWADCQFPYPHYDKYLRKRGLDHLLPWAQWTGNPSYRTKNYINRLKILLRQRHPDKCASIVRNEAHVRLASSTWYVSGTLLALSAAGLLWLLALMLRRVASQQLVSPSMFGDFLPAFTCCVAVLSFSLYARISIAQFLHYQRMREVYYVLETALTALHHPPDDASQSTSPVGV